MKRKQKKIEKKSTEKDWRHAFLEKGIIKKDMLETYSSAKAIKIKRCDICTKYINLCGYVSQFNLGGFWFNETGLWFVTGGAFSDPEATYEDAIAYLESWEQ